MYLRTLTEPERRFAPCSPRIRPNDDLRRAAPVSARTPYRTRMVPAMSLLSPSLGPDFTFIRVSPVKNPK
jgi:hypothetical protein